MPKILFNSSLPRSGSTLLQNLLAQNPRIFASATSGLLELLYAARQNFTNLDEFKLQPKGAFDEAWKGFCRGAINGFYEGITDKPVCVDKSRGWSYFSSWLWQFQPDAKIIVCVRDLRAIVASMEKLHHKNAHLHDSADNPAAMNFVTVDQRVGHWMSNPPVGLGVNRLMDALQNGNAERFHFVRYEDLMREPEKTMGEIYQFVDEEPFKHDFGHIEQLVPENDAVHGKYGSHQVSPVLEAVKPDWETVLGPAISAAIVVKYQWFYKRFYP